jgi:hypothetical protein
MMVLKDKVLDLEKKMMESEKDKNYYQMKYFEVEAEMN